MKPPPLTSQSPAVYAVVLLLTLAPPLYYASYRYRLAHPYASSTTTSSSDDKPASNDFVREWLAHPLITPYNRFFLANYCSRTTWHPNLIFHLSNANGGIGNVRGNTLDFLLYAIEAGASVILPSRAARNEQDLGDVWASTAEFGSFFDEEWFLRALHEACPEMAVYKPEAGQALEGQLDGVYLPRSRRLDVDAGNTREAYEKHLTNWVEKNAAYKGPDEVAVINTERTLWEYDTRSLPPGLRRNLGQLLKSPPALLRLAALVVKNLAIAYNLPLNPRHPIPQGAFYGAHLRTESDALAAGWLDDGYSNFTAQTTAYITHALSRGLRVIYCASGNTTDLARFKQEAALRRVNVTSKFDLLPPAEAERLRKFSWDEQALVDYEVLLRCSVFGGIVKSSFAYNIAMTRDERLRDEGRVVEPWGVLHREEGVGFDDGVSRVLGRDDWHEERIPRGMWP